MCVVAIRWSRQTPNAPRNSRRADIAGLAWRNAITADAWVTPMSASTPSAPITRPASTTPCRETARSLPGQERGELAGMAVEVRGARGDEPRHGGEEQARADPQAGGEARRREAVGEQDRDEHDRQRADHRDRQRRAADQQCRDEEAREHEQ